MAHPTLEKYRGKLVSIRYPGQRGKRTGWIIDEDDDEYDWRDDLGDAEEQVEDGELLPLIYLGEIEDGELVEADGFLLMEPGTQDLYLVDEGSLEDEPLCTLDELVITPLSAAAEEDDDDDDEDFEDREPGGDDEELGGGGDDEDEDADEEYREDDGDDE